MSPYVLVVQSDAGLQRLIADALREANYELSTEREATWAERSVLVRPPDAVVLDTRLGDGSGFRVAESLRRDPDTRSIPIFFVSTRSEGQAQTTEIRRRYQPAEVIPVPFEINTLLSHLLQRVPPPDMPARTRKPSIPPSVPVDAAAEAEAHRVEVKNTPNRCSGYSRDNRLPRCCVDCMRAVVPAHCSSFARTSKRSSIFAKVIPSRFAPTC